MPSDALEILSRTEKCVSWTAGLWPSCAVQLNKPNNFADHIQYLGFFAILCLEGSLTGCQSIQLFLCLGVFLPMRPRHLLPVHLLTNTTDVITSHTACAQVVSGSTDCLDPRWPGATHTGQGQGWSRVHVVQLGCRLYTNTWLFFPPLLGAKVTEFSFALCSMYAGCTSALKCC